MVVLVGVATVAQPRMPLDDVDIEELVFLRHWVPAEYPAEALKQKLSGKVQVRFVTDETGRVTSARALEAEDERFADAAVAAVKQWEIEPVKDGGRATASGLDVVVEFSPAIAQKKYRAGDTPPFEMLPWPSPSTPTRPGETPEGDYPASLESRRLNGQVVFRGTVMEDGSVVFGGVIDASHADFVIPTIKSLRKWRFTPAMQGDLALRTETQGVMTFTALETKPAEVLEAYRISLPNGDAPELPPAVAIACEAVWPIDRLLAGESGSAVVEFDVIENGQVKNVVVVEATQRDFGQSAVAAMEAWVFAPAPDDRVMVQLVKVPTQLERRRFKRVVEFASPKEAELDSEGRLAAAMKQGEIGGAKGLDEKLTPIYRVAPRYPQDLRIAGGPAGRAEVEFVIDREGRARLPRVVSATHEAFGWAAATAVSQWVFRSPRRGGEPVDVKVRMPFDFPAPKR